MASEPMTRSACFSDDRVFRYWLSRTWDEELQPLVVVGLNPSTADEAVDDPTVRRCIGFARAWGFGGLVMLNLFAFRATDPREMKAAADPVGPANDAWLRQQTSLRRVLCAWGAHGGHLNRSRRVGHLLADRDLVCLGRTAAGFPRHPLYLRADTAPEAYRDA